MTLDQVNDRCLAILRQLESTWSDFETDTDPLDTVAIYLLCGAGMVELRMRGRAWTDRSAIEFEACASGVWIDTDRRSILPDEIRRAVPAWGASAVAIQLQQTVQARLTSFGASQRTEVDPDTVQLFATYLAFHPTKGRVKIRVLGAESAAPGTVPQDAIDIPGVIHALHAIESAITSLRSQQTPNRDRWVRADTASRESNLHADTIRKRAQKEGWEVRKAGAMNAYRLADLKSAWPDKRFLPEESGMSAGQLRQTAE